MEKENFGIKFNALKYKNQALQALKEALRQRNVLLFLSKIIIYS